MELTVEQGLKLGVAVSGGVDSMVMLHMLKKSGANIVAINIEHGIRGAVSKRDSRFVINYCKRNEIECLAYTVNSPQYAVEHGLSVELAARTLRYEIFDNLLKEKTVDCIALAHHMNDQVETVLMRIFRGTGIKGLRGIVDRAGYVHPMLNFTKQEIRDYAALNRVPYKEDATNFDSEYTRNYIRHEVIPHIKTRFPGFEKAVCKLASSAEEVEDYLVTTAPKAQYHKKGATLPIEVLDLHPALAKKTIAEALRGLGCDKDIESSHLEALISLKDSPNNSKLNLPFGYDAYRSYTELRIVERVEAKDYEQEFDLRRMYEFGDFRYTFCETDKMVKGLTFDAGKVPEGAVVRTRREGDKFRRYAGANKSLSDYLTDVKIPLYIRDKLLVIAKDSIVYAVLGVEISDEVKIDDTTEKKYLINIGECE
ncbi:MAG: tRNA lysidine(34) synthetase TilS [Clostridia bacterium]|nr:tRNA lysidine(34) synthetase TilS [Clostridia bacterium]